MRIAILGGGLGGLTAAYTLRRQEQSCEVTIYESSARLGGLIETARRDGFTVECGADSWVTEKPWAEELAGELGLDDQILRSSDDGRRTYLARGSTLLPLPEGMRMMVPTDLEAVRRSPLFSPEAIAAYEGEPLRAAELRAAALERRGPHADESVAAFVRRHFGDEVTRTVAAPLLAGVFGGDIERLSACALLAPFVALEAAHGSLIAGLGQHRRPSPPSVFTTFRGGLGVLTDRLAAGLPPAGVRLSTPVRALHREPGGWAVETEGGRESFDRVLLALPLEPTRRLLSAVPEAREAASLLPRDAVSALVVGLAFGAGARPALRLPPGFGFLVPEDRDRGPGLLAATFVSQKFAGRAPAGSSVVRAFFARDAADSLASLADGAIVALAREQLGAYLGPLPERAEISLVRRLPRSLPQYEVGHLARAERFESQVGALPGLAVTGNALRGVGLPDIVREARRAARALLEA